MLLKSLENSLDFVKEKGLYPDIHEISGPSTNPIVKIGGREVVAFCSNNYLGMATHPEIIESVKNAVSDFGMGSGGSRLVSGNIDIQKKLERAVANFKNAEDAILFSTGYMTNSGAIPALIGPTISSRLSVVKTLLGLDRGVVFSDRLNHASIIDGVRLSDADRYIYKHKDMKDLEDGLKKYKGRSRKLIVTDGVFSMDGDITPLHEILELAHKYDALILLDDAHATGVLGEKGRGTAEYYCLHDNERLLTMGTFTKAFGGVGGFIAGPKKIIDYLRISSRTYIFSAPIPPAIASGLLKSVEILTKDLSNRNKLRENVLLAHKLLKESGFNILESETQIIPIIVGDEIKAQDLSRKLLDKGYFIPAVRWPATEKGLARLRMTVMSSHTKEQIENLVKTLSYLKEELSF